jgi:hypothetical protein
MMSAKKRLMAALVVTPAVTAVAFLVLCMVSPHAKDWIKFRVFYRDYLVWKTQGGPIQAGFYAPLMLDRNRDDMVCGLSYEQILAKFPFLVDGDRYSPISYKGQYLNEARGSSPGARVLWFRQEDEFDWGVYLDGSRTEIVLVKG